MTTPTDRRAIWETYTSSWTAGSTAERLATYASCLSSDVSYTDPNVAANGYDELAQYMAGFQQQLPGGGFVTKDFSDHHDVAIINWDMVDAAGNVLSPGTSFGGDDGLLKSMTGFFEG
ncbi:MAG: nuclear transport factor 2 family protein [Acidimicrobiales bacterium]